MAPLNSRAGPIQASKKIINGANQMDYNEWCKTCTEEHKYAVVNRSTTFVCDACFADLGRDPTNHFRLVGGCGISVAAHRMCVLAKENATKPVDLEIEEVIENGNTATDNGNKNKKRRVIKRLGPWYPEYKIVVQMLNDKECPVKPMDILCQSSGWDPRTKFEAEPPQPTVHVSNKHTCSSATTAMSFIQHYQLWEANNQVFCEALQKPIEFDTRAARRADDIKQFGVLRGESFDDAIQVDYVHKSVYNNLRTEMRNNYVKKGDIDALKKALERAEEAAKKKEEAAKKKEEAAKKKEEEEAKKKADSSTNASPAT